MASGHTNRATINLRRPLSLNMLAFLELVEASRGEVARRGLSTADKSAERGLSDRGYLTVVDYANGQHWAITPAGRAALAQPSDGGEA